MNMLRNKLFSVLATLSVVLTPLTIHAENAGLVNGIWFSQEKIFAGDSVRIFAVVQNETDGALNDTVTFLVDDAAVGTVNVSLASGTIDRVEIKHTFTEGNHTVSTRFSAGDIQELSRNVFIDTDTDGDGIGNKDDDDDDNDGIVDTEDAEPLIKNDPPQEGVLAGALNTSNLASSTTAILDTLLGTSTDATSTGARVAQTARGAAGGALNALQALEGVRERGAENLQRYQEEQRQKIDTIERVAEEGFQASSDEEVPTEDEKTQAHIAAAGAAVLGSVLEHELMFYAHIVLLLWSLWHLIWGYFKRKYRAQY